MFTHQSLIARVASQLIICSILVNSVQILAIPIDLRDLENLAIVDSVNQHTLEKKLNHCYTRAGKDYFLKSFCELSSNIDILKQRQERLKLLMANSDMVFRLNNQLKICKNLEPVLETFSLPNGTTLSVLDEFYFKHRLFTRLNKSAECLNASFFLHYLGLFQPIVEHYLLHAGIKSFFSSECKHAHHHGCGHSHDHSSNTTNSTFYYLLQGGHLVHFMVDAFQFYEMAAHMSLRQKKISRAQAEIAQLKSYLGAVQSIYDQLRGNDPLFITMYTPALAQIFSAHSGNPAANMITTLAHSSWKSLFQSALNPGAILAMYASLKAQTMVLQKIAYEVGIIDAYLNIVNVMLAQKNRYCFVTFVENSGPQLYANNLWHHAISPERMQPIQVTLDKNNSCLVMRGANGSGKSTLLTAVGQAVFLSQSWAIAPAQELIMTPFLHFYTHSLKRDSIENGLSHFYYEHAYYENMFAASDDGNTIVLLDEPYMCTNFQTGTKYLQILMEHIQQSTNKLGIITTHYEQ